MFNYSYIYIDLVANMKFCEKYCIVNKRQIQGMALGGQAHPLTQRQDECPPPLISQCLDLMFTSVTAQIIKPLMTGPKGNSEFCFPETTTVPRGEAEGNIESQGLQNSPFPKGPAIKCFVIPPNSKQNNTRMSVYDFIANVTNPSNLHIK